MPIVLMQPKNLWSWHKFFFQNVEPLVLTITHMDTVYGFFAFHTLTLIFMQFTSIMQFFTLIPNNFLVIFFSLFFIFFKVRGRLG